MRGRLGFDVLHVGKTTNSDLRKKNKNNPRHQ